MKLLAAAALAAFATLAPVRAAVPAKILFIGNSLTTVNDVPGMVQALSNSTMVCRTIAFNDHSLEDHWNRPEARKAIAEGGWSTVILQQGPSALPESRALLIEYVKRFDTEIRKVGARSGIYAVWPSWQRRGDFDAVSASHAAAAKAVNGILLPVGDAWTQVWRRDERFSLYGLDGFHPTPAASYLAALVIYSSISGQSAAELPPRAGLVAPRLGLARNHTDLLQSAAAAANAAVGSEPLVHPSPRLAAVAFATSHGFEIPRTKLVVANEVRFGGINDVKPLPNDRSTTLTEAETVADTGKIAAMLGSSVKNVAGGSVMACGRPAGLSTGQCKTTADVWALVVEELKNDGKVVHIKLHPPNGEGRVGHAFVDIERRGAGWVAMGFITAPIQAGGR